MLDHMKALQIMFYKVPDHEAEWAKIRQIRGELKQKLDMAGKARLQCLLDTEWLLQEKLNDEYFAVGFRVGWNLMNELWEAGVMRLEEGPPTDEEDDNA